MRMYIVNSLYALVLLISSSGLAAEQAPYKNIQVDNDLRQYRLFVPASYTDNTPLPLVLNFHGTSNTPDRQEALSDFEKLAEKERFIVVTPLALFTRTAGGPITWNANKKPGPDDVNFITLLLHQLQQDWAIDNKRIYATGFSGGARMSSRLGCDLADRIAAIAPVAGLRFPTDCQPYRSVPIMTFHGEKDGINHFILREDSPVYWTMGVEDALAGWIKHNQCNAPVQTALSSSLTEFAYQGCSHHADIVFYRSTEAGHTWPGSPMAEQMLRFGLGKTEESLAATDLIWQFFKAHPLP
ncbi:alpha/beta hydrolase family esterase [Flavobacterium sp. W21_SRS_FM6]|uniref:alpha/beta hydrolase family esterase n=1 Tax=Flavobacterium sp. W21_SRS_FM6 TaxID=3240268 RepID=UPI003F8F0EEB